MCCWVAFDRRKQTRVSPSPLVNSDDSSISELIHDAATSMAKLVKQAADFGTGGAADVSAILSALGSGDSNWMPPMKLQIASLGAH